MIRHYDDVCQLINMYEAVNVRQCVGHSDTAERGRRQMVTFFWSYNHKTDSNAGLCVSGQTALSGGRDLNIPLSARILLRAPPRRRFPAIYPAQSAVCRGALPA